MATLADPAGAVAPILTIENIEERSDKDSAPTKTIGARCDDGKVLLGAWGMVADGEGEVMLTGVWPQAIVPGGPPQQAMARAEETSGGSAADWSLRVFATCASDVPPGAVSMEISPTFSSISPRVTTASCGPDRIVVGTGGRVSLTAGVMALTAFYPLGNLSGVRAEASENGAYAATGALRRTPSALLLRTVAPYAPGLPRSAGVGAEIRVGTAPQWFLTGFAICASNLQV